MCCIMFLLPSKFENRLKHARYNIFSKKEDNTNFEGAYLSDGCVDSAQNETGDSSPRGSFHSEMSSQALSSYR